MPKDRAPRVPKPFGTGINIHEDFALAVYPGKAPVAAKYLRRQTWRIRFYHPHSGELIRASLDTHDEARAELLRQRVALETTLLKAAEALRQPRFKAAEIYEGGPPATRQNLIFAAICCDWKLIGAEGTGGRPSLS